MSKREEEWSKERIQIELKELEKAAMVRFWVGFSFLMGGVMAFMAMLSQIGYGRPSTYIFLYAFISIGLILGGMLLLRKWRGKRRQYNELKARL
ncbi:MAG: hypothetical protein H3Z53_01990 [archaeon]|nr:hypothetical protein [archaeon]